ncbi:sulfotransferase [Kineosporia rhizophila]|uniref:sulfotransferase family protein n=1 Tax=Kineosporia TaxID=49184 RepID=UPI001E31394A|nr:MULTISPECIES: sulfotransferase [Kineosporia]MCE0538979.1 sulfotransferase [Kineosporia rhizophila]GLY16158.1 sulfotransferase [Kineosporia sp. NBRC 101677]
MALPDFFLLGAPKAGTTALHAALAQHPQLFLSAVKEPKFYMCDGRPPPRSQQRGPGDAHSAQEWVWRRGEYEALFDVAPAGTLKGESTPFYLYDRQAQRRIAADVPHARLLVVLRDPIDRAYSNWMHLRSDGLEPIADFAEAWAAEDERVAAGWAPFWHYRRLGLYGEQLRDLIELFGRDQVHVLRYRDLVETPEAALGKVCAFLGVEPGQIEQPARENSRSYVPPGRRTEALSRVVRAGAAAGAYLPPQVWRQVSEPLLRYLQKGGARRPVLDASVRMRLVEAYREDNALLNELAGQSFSDWMGTTSRGQFAPSATES